MLHFRPTASFPYCCHIFIHIFHFFFSVFHHALRSSESCLSYISSSFCFSCLPGLLPVYFSLFLIPAPAEFHSLLFRVFCFHFAAHSPSSSLFFNTYCHFSILHWILHFFLDAPFLFLHFILVLHTLVSPSSSIYFQFHLSFSHSVIAFVFHGHSLLVFHTIISHISHTCLLFLPLHVFFISLVSLFCLSFLHCLFISTIGQRYSFKSCSPSLSISSSEIRSHHYLITTQLLFFSPLAAYLWHINTHWQRQLLLSRLILLAKVSFSCLALSLAQSGISSLSFLWRPGHCLLSCRQENLVSSSSCLLLSFSASHFSLHIISAAFSYLLRWTCHFCLHYQSHMPFSLSLLCYIESFSAHIFIVICSSPSFTEGSARLSH